MIPVPGHPEGTPFGERGPHWSCDRNAAGDGIHTGVDFPADIGVLVIAARPGTAVYADHGADFGNHQLEIRCTDGTRDFYAHMSARVIPDGAHVAGGDPVGRIGEEGNAFGPHLHFERHAVATGPWSCDIIRDPQPSLDWTPPEVDMPLTEPEWTRLQALIDARLVAFGKNAGDLIKVDNPTDPKKPKWSLSTAIASLFKRTGA